MAKVRRRVISEVNADKKMTSYGSFSRRGAGIRDILPYGTANGKNNRVPTTHLGRALMRPPLIFAAVSFFSRRKGACAVSIGAA